MAIQPIQLTPIDHAAALAPADSCGCGGGSCAVGPAATVAVAASEGREILVDGMTCDHCVRAVTAELGALEGVDDVTVDLIAGGSSRVHVRASTPVDDDAVRTAIEEAGYRLA